MKVAALKLSKHSLLLPLIISVGLFLRLYPSLDSILFTYDQARDAVYAQGIIHGQFKIVGPQSDIPNLFHGPLFYYLLAPAYFVTGGYPYGPLIELIIINLLTILPLYFLAKRLFHSTTFAVITVALFSVSFEAVSYARWISNPSLALPALTTFYLGLWMIINKEKQGWLLAALGCAVAIHAQIFLIYLIPFFIFCLALYKVNLRPRKHIVAGLVLFSILMSSFVIAEVKFQFQGYKDLTSFLFATSSDNSFKAANFINLYNRLTELIAANIFYQSKVLSLLVSLLSLGLSFFFAVKNRHLRPLLFIMLMLFSAFGVLLISTFSAHFATIGATIPLLVLMSYVVWQVSRTYKLVGYLLLSALVLANISSVVNYNGLGSILFKVQDGMIFRDEMKVVQKTYELSGDSQFSINAVTNPLSNPTTWGYLYQIYANKHKLEKPLFHGLSDPTSVGYNILPRFDEVMPVEFTIIEPDMSQHWTRKTLEFDDLRKPQSYPTRIGSFTLVVRGK